MEVEVLCTADCPNAAALIAYLEMQVDVALTVTLVTDRAPVPHAFAGSPTVLVDGVNPFGGGHLDAPACALSPPTIPELQDHLRHRATPS